MHRRYAAIIVFFALCPVADFKPIVLDPSFEHDKWGTAPRDRIFEFAAFVSSFDSADDNDGSGLTEDCWGIPEWVAYEIKKIDKEPPSSRRPSSWITPKGNPGEFPTDDTYAVSGTEELKEVKGDYRYVRGHMCPKDVADRISPDAAWNTHTVVNAVPPLQWQNNGIWKQLERQCTDWADEYGRIWVVCGPVFFGKSPAVWLGQDSETKAAIPDALFKLVIRQEGSGLEVLGFLIPNVVPKAKKYLEEFLTTVDHIEELTGLDFLSSPTVQAEEKIESKKGKLTDWK